MSLKSGTISIRRSRRELGARASFIGPAVVKVGPTTIPTYLPLLLCSSLSCLSPSPPLLLVRLSLSQLHHHLLPSALRSAASGISNQHLIIKDVALRRERSLTFGWLQKNILRLQ